MQKVPRNKPSLKKLKFKLKLELSAETATSNLTKQKTFNVFITNPSMKKKSH